MQYLYQVSFCLCQLSSVLIYAATEIILAKGEICVIKWVQIDTQNRILMLLKSTLPVLQQGDAAVQADRITMEPKCTHLLL